MRCVIDVLTCGLAAGLVMLAPSPIDAEQTQLSHVEVTAEGLPDGYPEAIARTVEAARQVCVDQYGFDMPEMIHVQVSLSPRNSVRLFNDGSDRFSLSVKTDRDLRRPSMSGIFHIYGLCHEVAHLAMYRPIADHSWLTTAGAEGWAHWLGSHIVDAVYKQEGEELWPDRYDYREDGVQRLEKQLAAAEPSEIAQGARLWGELAQIVGPDNLVEVFIAWGQADIDPADPQAALAPSLGQFGDAERLAAWWKEAGPLLLLKREQSRFPLTYGTRAKLVNEPRELANDDGKAAGKKSLAGGGHAVRFEMPDNSWYLTSVTIHGARYGAPKPPKEDFEIFLCDGDFNVITTYDFPYSKFPRGREKAVAFRVRPTNVPQQFFVGVNFNPTATKGVYVTHDAEGSGHSVTGLPGRTPRDFTQGDWLIRINVDQAKAADALTSGDR